MTKEKLDTRAIGLDVGLAFVKWLTGAENLHYGYWKGLSVSAANLGPAQVAYTDRLFALLPKGPLRILDIGGGAGETARKLTALGHEVDIVIPSAYLADRCRANAPKARVHHMMFEDFRPQGQFDVCLFSESFQYIALGESLPRCIDMLAPGGRIVIADSFRSARYRRDGDRAVVGGGHSIADYRAAVAALPLDVTHEEDITAEVAPSVDIEQGLFNVVGLAVTRIDAELAAKRRRLRSLLHWVWRRITSERRRLRLGQRLMEQSRNAGVYAEMNTYLMTVLEPRR